MVKGQKRHFFEKLGNFQEKKEASGKLFNHVGWCFLAQQPAPGGIGRKKNELLSVDSCVLRA